MSRPVLRLYEKVPGVTSATPRRPVVADPAARRSAGRQHWSVEVCVYNPFPNGHDTAVSWGDRPWNIAEFNIGDDLAFVSYDNGDLAWQQDPPTGQWVYIAWTHRPAGEAPGDNGAGYIEFYVNGELVQTGHFPQNPLNVHGGDNTLNNNPVPPITVGSYLSYDNGTASWGEFWGQPMTARSARRIHERNLTADQILNNYEAEAEHYADKPEVEIGGELLVDLTAEDIDEQIGRPVRSWTNRGTLGDFILPQDSTRAPILDRYGFARGVTFSDMNDALILDGALPEALQGDSSWTVEVWAYNPTDDGLETAVAFGDRPWEVAEFELGGDLSFVTYEAGDAPWSGGIPPLEQWNHITWTHRPASEAPGDGGNGFVEVYVNGVLNTTYEFELGPLDVHGGDYPDNNNPEAPLSIGGYRSYDAGTAGWGGFWGKGLEGTLGAVRVHTGYLTAEQILNNYEFEKDHYAPIPDGGPIAVAGELAVDLDAGDLTPVFVTDWPNRGILGGFRPADNNVANRKAGHSWRFQRSNFANNGDGLVCIDGAPAGLVGDSAWTIEVWAYNPQIDGLETVVAIGDRPDNIAEFNIGTPLSFVTYSVGDAGWDQGPPPVGEWVHVAWTHRPASEAPGDNGNGLIEIYVNGKLNTTFSGFTGPLNTHFGEAGAPITIGSFRNSTTGGWGGSYGLPLSGAISRVRIHTGYLTADEVLNNYYTEVDEFLGKPVVNVVSNWTLY